MLSRNDIVRGLGAETAAKGQAICRDGGVRRIVVADDGGSISGSVQGSAPRPYSQIIALKSRGTALTIEGHCSCPMNYNCKHVAAVLLGHLQTGATETVREAFGDFPTTGPASTTSSRGVQQRMPPQSAIL